MTKLALLTTKDELTEAIREAVKEASAESPKINLLERMNRRSAAEFIGVSYQTMYNWTKSGLLKEHGIGRKKFYLRQELIEAINWNR